VLCHDRPVRGSYWRAPKAITLDIDNTADTVMAVSGFSLFNAHYDERRFLPIHIYMMPIPATVL
jgi:hypothetical protein